MTNANGAAAVMPVAAHRPHRPRQPVSSCRMYRPKRVQTSKVSYTNVVNAINPNEIPNAAGTPITSRKLPIPCA